MQSIILFATWAGTVVKNLKNMFRDGQIIAKRCKMCTIYGSSVCNHGNACRKSDKFVLDFIRGDMWLLLGILFSSESLNLFIFLPKSEAKNRP